MGASLLDKKLFLSLFSRVSKDKNRSKRSFNFDLDFSLDSYYALYLDP